MKQKLFVAALLILGYIGVGALFALMIYGTHKGFWALAVVLAFVCFITTANLRGADS